MKENKWRLPIRVLSTREHNQGSIEDVFCITERWRRDQFGSLPDSGETQHCRESKWLVASVRHLAGAQNRASCVKRRADEMQGKFALFRRSEPVKRQDEFPHCPIKVRSRVACRRAEGLMNSLWKGRSYWGVLKVRGPKRYWERWTIYEAVEQRKKRQTILRTVWSTSCDASLGAWIKAGLRHTWPCWPDSNQVRLSQWCVCVCV